ncbi:hypothetical protein D3C85_1505230 [compost metagenome]
MLRKAGSFVIKLQNQFDNNFSRLRTPVKGTKCTSSQTSQAANPPKYIFGKSTTALNFDIMAMLPLFL